MSEAKTSSAGESHGAHGIPLSKDSISFPDEEERTLAFWAETKAFETSLKLSEGRPEFTFYDGPPFATGLPHYGHILAGTIKDTVTRWAHQTGHHVSRRFGWDCHGLPVEYEIDKKLGVTSTEDVEKMGIAAYNGECRSIVSRYCHEWETIVSRMGRWIDFRHDYKTMEPWYMESVWWVFRQLHDKGLVYRGFKVMPYSTQCNTPLSNFEANLNYKEVDDPAVVVSFPLVDDPEAALLAWTTTPWTLPSNLALCVHPELVYVRIRDAKTGGTFILAESRLPQLYPRMAKKGYKGGEFEVLDKMPGKSLEGRRYVPLFDYFRHMEGTAFRVLTDGYVTDDSGTGVVHCAPAFGEDDYRVCMAHGVVTKGGELPCPVDANGRFTAQVPDFAGVYVKDADHDILARLKAERRLVQRATLKHSYPFCWRSETPLIYRAVPSWFVRVESIKERLLEANAETYWVPDFVKAKRFHNWLKDARDWAVSRNRYWGTPLPIWTSEDGEEVVVVGSIAELEELSGVKVTDLHREHVDDITIPSRTGRGVLRRVPEVFDCWFESGSMPYAQQHYPFENKEYFERNFPADFIAEGLDQTRGWFYTLMVLSVALFDKPAFKNLIVNGLVLAADGKKMSKRLKNYPDPMLVANSHGADALRMYLIDSPVVRAEPLRFEEAGVKGVVRDLLLPWYNAFRFFVQNARRWETAQGRPFTPDLSAVGRSGNPMDHWLLAEQQDVVEFVRREMAAYRLYTVLPRLVRFINDLTNWYVRLNRTRLKGADEEAAAALRVLYEALLSLTRTMAPFTPFFTEFMYRRLRLVHPDRDNESLPPDAPGRAESVHFTSIPTVDASLVDAAIVRKVHVMQRVVELGRLVRERRNISLKMPVKRVVVAHKDPAVLEAVRDLAQYVHEELNMRELELEADDSKWCTLTATAQSKVLGPRLGKAMGPVLKAVKQLTHEQVEEYLATGSLEVAGVVLGEGDLTVRREVSVDTTRFEAAVDAEGTLTVVVDLERDEGLVMQGLAREVVNRVQRLRKDSGLTVGEPCHAFVAVEAGEGNEAQAALLKRALELHFGTIARTVGTLVPLPLLPLPSRVSTIAVREAAVPVEDESGKHVNVTLSLHLTRPGVYLAPREAFPSLSETAHDAVEGMVAALGTASMRSRMDTGSGRCTLKVMADGTKGGAVTEVELVEGETLFFDPAALVRKHFAKTFPYV